MVTPEFVAIGWKYLRRYFRLAELYIAERRNRLPAISWKPSRTIGGPILAAVLFWLWRSRRRPGIGIERC